MAAYARVDMAHAFLLLLHAAFAASLAVRDAPTTPVCANGMWCPQQAPTGKLLVVIESSPSQSGNALPDVVCAYPDPVNPVYDGCQYDAVRPSCSHAPAASR
jgi:hypothetical protein